MSAYREVVFLQGEEATKIINRLGRVDGVLYRGHTDETVAHTVEHLAELDSGEGEVRGDATFGDSTLVEHGRYVLSWSPRNDYIGLYRKVARCWADAFGTWHAAVVHEEEYPEFVARRAIINALVQRERHIEQSVVRVVFERHDRETREWVYRERARG